MARSIAGGYYDSELRTRIHATKLPNDLPSAACSIAVAESKCVSNFPERQAG
jgi:hypothetical protein